MQDELNPSDSFPDGDVTDVAPAGGTENDSLAVGLKDLVKQATGRDYSDDDTALKAIQETFKYVGQAGQKEKQLEKQINELKSQAMPSDLNEKVNSLERQLQETQFYAQNPDYNDDVVKSLIKDMGGNPAEVIQKDSFQKAYAAIKANNEAETLKSVLHTNSRLGQVSDKLTQAREAAKSGNQTAAGDLAVTAVLEAYDMK